MSLDLDFNKSLSTKEIEEKTSLKVNINKGSEYLIDQYGNTVFFKGYGLTLRGMVNPTKIIDELIKAFDIMFIDDDAIDKLYYEPEKYGEEELFLQTMVKYGYCIKDGKVVLPERNEADYLPYPAYPEEYNGEGGELPF